MTGHGAPTSTNLSGMPVPVFNYPHSKEIFSAAQSDPPMAQLCAIPLLPLAPRSRVWHLPLLSLLKEMQRAVRPPFLQTGQPSCPHRTSPSSVTSFAVLSKGLDLVTVLHSLCPGPCTKVRHTCWVSSFTASMQILLTSQGALQRPSRLVFTDVANAINA